MFVNEHAVTDPAAIAQATDCVAPAHTCYYSPTAYWAPDDIVWASGETITVHFNAPLSVRWLTLDQQADELEDKHLTLAVTNESQQPVLFLKNTPLDIIIASPSMTNVFQLSSAVYRHQIVMDTTVPDLSDGPG